MLRHQWTFRFNADQVRAACQRKLSLLRAEQSELQEKNRTAEAEGLELSRSDSSKVSSLQRTIETYSQWEAALALRGKETLALQIDDVIFFELEKSL